MERRRATDAEREASRWIARLEASDVSLDDHQRFRAWLDASPENRIAYDALSRTWDQLDALKFGSAAEAPPKPSRRWFLVGAASASVIAVAGASTWMLTSGASQAAVYETPIGGRHTVRLDDGTRIELNAASRIAVRYGDTHRRVALERGEALFEVAVDTARPFLIETRFGDFRVTGTSLSVKLTPMFARATVLEGSVEVVQRGSAALTATAQEEISLADNGAKTAVEARLVERRLAWRSGMLAFDGETLREAALDVERQTGARFEFSNDETADMRVGGLINARDTNAFVALLRTNLNLTVERRADGVFLVAGR